MITRRSSTGATTDEDILSRPAYLFVSGRWRAVSTRRDMTELPPPPNGAPWCFERSVALGVQRVELPGTEPEPVVTGLAANGYYIWQISTDETAAL